MSIYLGIAFASLVLLFNMEDKDIPFGNKLGEVNNVIAYSSGINQYVCNDVKSLQPNYYNNIFTGLKYQCVEFARRYLIITRGITFEEVDNAYQIFDIQNFINLKGYYIPTIKSKNIADLKIGSLIIWSKTINHTGHVAVVVHKTTNSIYIAEQNWCNKKWAMKFYSRKININKLANDMDIIGWVQY